MVDSVNHVIQINAIQFNAIQFNAIQFNNDVTEREKRKEKNHFPQIE
jgi:hypothetical protein